MISILPETKEFYAAIHEINVLAFGRESEARLVENIRKSSDFIPELSLVAAKEGRVVGHILFSRITIQTENGILPALALAPMAVHPKFQNKGIGSSLVWQGLKDCRNQGYEIVVVIGHPNYYPRFVFTSARANGPETNFSVADEAFMVIELTSGALNMIGGMVIYPPVFDEV